MKVKAKVGRPKKKNKKVKIDHDNQEMAVDVDHTFYQKGWFHMTNEEIIKFIDICFQNVPSWMSARIQTEWNWVTPGYIFISSLKEIANMKEEETKEKKEKKEKKILVDWRFRSYLYEGDVDLISFFKFFGSLFNGSYSPLNSNLPAPYAKLWRMVDPNVYFMDTYFLTINSKEVFQKHFQKEMEIYQINKTKIERILFVVHIEKYEEKKKNMNLKGKKNMTIIFKGGIHQERKIDVDFHIIICCWKIKQNKLCYVATTGIRRGDLDRIRNSVNLYQKWIFEKEDTIKIEHIPSEHHPLGTKSIYYFGLFHLLVFSFLWNNNEKERSEFLQMEFCHPWKEIQQSFPFATKELCIQSCTNWIKFVFDYYPTSSNDILVDSKQGERTRFSLGLSNTNITLCPSSFSLCNLPFGDCISEDTKWGKIYKLKNKNQDVVKMVFFDNGNLIKDSLCWVEKWLRLQRESEIQWKIYQSKLFEGRISIPLQVHIGRLTEKEVAYLKKEIVESDCVYGLLQMTYLPHSLFIAKTIPWIKEGKITIHSILLEFAQIIFFLKHLNIVHGDLHPGNFGYLLNEKEEKTKKWQVNIKHAKEKKLKIDSENYIISIENPEFTLQRQGFQGWIPVRFCLLDFDASFSTAWGNGEIPRSLSEKYSSLCFPRYPCTSAFFVIELEYELHSYLFKNPDIWFLGYFLITITNHFWRGDLQQISQVQAQVPDYFWHQMFHNLEKKLTDEIFTPQLFAKKIQGDEINQFARNFLTEWSVHVGSRVKMENGKFDPSQVSGLLVTIFLTPCSIMFVQEILGYMRTKYENKNNVFNAYTLPSCFNDFLQLPEDEIPHFIQREEKTFKLSWIAKFIFKNFDLYKNILEKLYDEMRNPFFSLTSVQKNSILVQFQVNKWWPYLAKCYCWEDDSDVSWLLMDPFMLTAYDLNYN